jgi:acylglycerol lipase
VATDEAAGGVSAADIAHDTEYVSAPGDASHGEKIFVQRWRPANAAPRAALVLSHGLGEHAGPYQPFIEHFVPRGAVIYAHDHRGFGRSEGRRGHVPRYERYIEDLLPLVQRAHAENPRLPLVLVGHSMGGTIALLFALRHPELLTAAVFSAPALIIGQRVSPVQRAMLRTLSRLYPTYTRTGVSNPAYLTRDPALQQQTARDTLRHTHTTARLLSEMFDRAPREVLAHVGGLRVPFIILHGTDDPLVRVEASQRVYDDSPAPGRAIKIYPGLRHELFREIERREVFDDVVAWLAGRGITLSD